jgi:cytochrome c oxidase subunit 2
MLRRFTPIPLRIAAGMGLFFASQPGAWAGWELDLLKGTTELSQSILSLDHLIFFVCVAIAFTVFGAILYSIFSFRKSRGAEQANFHRSIKTEIAWTVIPFLIVIGMTIPSAKEVVRIEDVSQPDMSAETTPSQRQWQHEHFAEGDSYYSNETDRRGDDALSAKLETLDQLDN